MSKDQSQHLGRLRTQDKMGAGQKGEDQAGWGRSLLIYPRVARNDCSCRDSIGQERPTGGISPPG